MARTEQSHLPDDGQFDRALLEQTAHRPWPMPERPWLMRQTWRDLLFAHWRVDPDRLRAVVPPMFDLDTFDGRAWIGVVPFVMTNVAPRGIPALPWLSTFPELNVRTYVRFGDRPGVFFFSLDAASRLAVAAARVLLNLPYHAATMRIERTPPRIDGESEIDYESRRRASRRLRSAAFHATYRPAGPAFTATEGSLEHFVAERYCLYEVNRRGAPYRLDIHHLPWRLQPASARIVCNTMADASGVSLPDEPPRVHFARRQDAIAWAPCDPRH